MAAHMEFEFTESEIIDENIPEDLNDPNLHHDSSAVKTETPGPLFPAYNRNQRANVSNIETRDTSSRSQQIETSLDWLSLNSFSDVNTHALTELQKESLRENETPNDTFDKPQNLEQIHSKDRDRKTKKKKSKEKRRAEKYKSEKETASSVYHQLSHPIIKDKNESGLYDVINQKVFIEETGLALERAFRVDKKPDFENLAFETFYKNHIAVYRKPFHIPIGLDKKSPLYASLLLGQDVKRKRKKDERYFTSENFRKYSESNVTLTVAKDVPNSFSLEYLPLSLESKQLSKAESNINPLGIYDYATEDYLSGISLSKVKETANEAKNNVSSSSASEQRTWLKLSNQKTEEYNRLLRENPKDEKLWLEFVAFQDELMKSDPYGRDKLDGKRLEVGCLERKLAILDRALSSIPSSVELAVLRLNMSNLLWDREKVSAEWKKMIFVHPSQPKVWQNYLQFLQSSFSTFNVQTVIKGYIKAISTLAKVNDGSFRVHTLPENLEEKMLDLVAEFVQFLMNSGHSERAIATYQALVEFNLFPPNLGSESSLSDFLAFFEPFWDSGVARVGEDGSKGWGEVVTHKLLSASQSTGFTELNEKEDAVLESYSADFKVWYQFELLRECHHWLPWRPNYEQLDTEPCEDPVRMVSVEDVTSVLFKVKKEENMFILILHFLSLLGVLVPWRKWCFLDHLNLLCIPSELHFKDKPKPVTNILQLPTTVCLESLNEFVTNFISHIKPVLSAHLREELELIFIKHKVREVLIQKTVKRYKDFSSELKSVKKSVKTLLSVEANRNNLNMWIEYLQLDLASDNLSSAQKVFTTIFTAQQRNVNIWRFIWTYIKALLTMKVELNRKELLCILACLTNGGKYNPKQCDTPRVAILKARTGYEAATKTLASSKCSTEFLIIKMPSNFTCCNICYAFFLYLSGFSTAEAVLDRLLSDSTLSSTDREEAYLGWLHLLLFQNSSLRSLRKTVEIALKDFPSNTTFLGLFLNTEGGSYLTTNTRRFFSQLLTGSREPDSIEWFYAVLSEVQHLQTIQSLKEKGEGEIQDVGIVWRVRSLFEKALKKQNIKYRGDIWRFYMQFEIRFGTKGRAKAVFYRSLQNCPGFKLLYMDATTYFPEDLTLILELMSEKDVRLRTPLEEIQMLMDHHKGGDVDDSSADEGRDVDDSPVDEGRHDVVDNNIVLV